MAEATTGPRRLALQVGGVTVRFAGIVACEDLTFDLAKGETLAVIGPNGAGKTTLVNAITGAVRAAPGSSIRIALGDGFAEATRLRPDQIVRLGLVRTFQNVLLVPHLDVRDNVLMGRYVYQRSGIVPNVLGFPGAAAEARANRDRVDAILETMGIARYAGDDVTRLAYGLRKRIELARALAMEPSILLLDEPVAGMSSEERRQMADYVRLARKTRPEMAILLIEHDMRFVMSLADRVMAINQGRMIATGLPDEIKVHPRVLESYLGPDSVGEARA